MASSVELTEERAGDFLRVGSGTDPDALAQAIVHSVQEGEVPRLRAIGPSAVYSAFRACISATSQLARFGFDLEIRPAEQAVEGRLGDQMTAMVFILVVTR